MTILYKGHAVLEWVEGELEGCDLWLDTLEDAEQWIRDNGNSEGLYVIVPTYIRSIQEELVS